MTSTDFLSVDQLEQDAAEAPKPVVTLDAITTLAEKMLYVAAEVEACEAALNAKKQEYDNIATKQLPDMLASVRMSNFQLHDGTVIEVVEQLGCGISPENREKAHSWLRENGFGDLIKNEITVTFGKGEDQDADLLMAKLDDMVQSNLLHTGGISQEERVHPATLKSFIKEQLTKGTAIPLDTFKVFTGQVAKLKRPKIKKT